MTNNGKIQCTLIQQGFWGFLNYELIKEIFIEALLSRS